MPQEADDLDDPLRPSFGWHVQSLQGQVSRLSEVRKENNPAEVAGLLETAAPRLPLVSEGDDEMNQLPTPLGEELSLLMRDLEDRKAHSAWLIEHWPTVVRALRSVPPAKQETGAKCIHFPACGCGGSGIVDSACWPNTPPSEIQRTPADEAAWAYCQISATSNRTLDRELVLDVLRDRIRELDPTHPFAKEGETPPSAGEPILDHGAYQVELPSAAPQASRKAVPGEVETQTPVPAVAARDDKHEALSAAAWKAMALKNYSGSSITDYMNELERELAEAKRDVNTLNEVLRFAGWGQGEIDCTAADVQERLEASQSAMEDSKSLLERTAQVAAHRVCCGTEHDAANGKLHGYCVVCGVPWPCEYAGTPPGAELRVVFDGPPSHESGRFVECEDSAGRSVNAGEWKQRADGLWELIVKRLPIRTGVPDGRGG